jgi:hypothetical protein
MLVFAHAGHWVIYVLYAVPFVVVGFSIVTTMLRQRREHEPAERDTS